MGVDFWQCWKFPSFIGKTNITKMMKAFEQPPASAAPTTALGKIMREPLAHFAAIGLALYLLSAAFADSPGQREILIDQTDMDRISATYRQQFGTAPTAEQLQQLLDHWVREEIYWREGVALGLDRGDEIVRRRVAQKFEFLQQDLAMPDAPSDDELRQHYQQHGDRYREPGRVTFAQIYIATNDARDPRVATVAARLPSAVESSHSLGDSFPGQRDVVALSATELARLFGDSEIVRAAFSTPTDQWHGPFLSGYGLHFIRVSDRTEPHLPALEEVAARVRADYLEERRQALNTDAYQQLRATYQITLAEDH